MDKSLRNLFLLIALSILCGILCAGTSYLMRKHYLQDNPIIKEVVRTDTITEYTPISVHDTIYKYVYVRLPIVKDEEQSETEKTQANPTEAKKPTGFSRLSDSVMVAIPITQKEYADTNYRAWVSGYQASLDSIKIYQRTIFREHPPDNKSRLHITLGVGAAFGRRVEPALFLGVGWSFYQIKI